MRRPTPPTGSFLISLALAVLAGCGGDSPLPTEPDPCPAALALMRGQWTGMVGDVHVTMALAPAREEGSLFGLPIAYDVMSGTGTANHPDDSRDISGSFKFSCFVNIGGSMVAEAPPVETGSGQTTRPKYSVANIEIQSVTSTRIVAVFTPVRVSGDWPNPFDAQVQVAFVRPPA